MKDVFDKVSQLIAAKKGIEPTEIALSHSFEELGLDSLDSVEVIGDLEDHFGVNIPNQEVLQIKTIQEAVDSLARLVNGQ